MLAKLPCFMVMSHLNVKSIVLIPQNRWCLMAKLTFKSWLNHVKTMAKFYGENMWNPPDTFPVFWLDFHRIEVSTTAPAGSNFVAPADWQSAPLGRRSRPGRRQPLGGTSPTNGKSPIMDIYMGIIYKWGIILTNTGAYWPPSHQNHQLSSTDIDY